MYLLLQHASGGRLWSYVSGYLQQNSPDIDQALDDPHERKLRAPEVHNHRTPDIVDSSRLPQPRSALSGTQRVKDIINPSYAKLKQAEAEHDKVTQCVHAGEKERYDPLAVLSAGPGKRVRATVRDIAETDDNDLVTTEGRKHAGKNVSYRRTDSLLADDSITGVVTDGETARCRETSPGVISDTSLDTGFIDLLQGTTEKPSLEQFSINSFDSDSAHVSRFDSTTSDHIESIPEITENSPLASPKKFAPETTWPSVPGPEEQRPDIIDSAWAVVREAEEALQLGDTVLSGDIATRLVVNKHSSGDRSDVDQSTADSKRDTQVMERTEEEEEEASIYDTFKSTRSDGSESGDSAADTPDHNIPQAREPEQDTHSSRSTDQMSISTDNGSVEQTIPNLSDLGSEGIATTTKPPVFRVQSQEDCADTQTAPRTRHLSSVFSSLDHRVHVDGQSEQARPRLPETCVRQWAAELVTILSQLHSMGLVCR